jgi:hypothetical protein
MKDQTYGILHQPVPLRKYIQAQRVIASETSPDDGRYLRAFGRGPLELYSFMRAMGFVWDAKRKRWRLHRRLKKSRFWDEVSQ